MTVTTPDAIAVTLAVVDVLEALGVAYHVGGSLASSLHGTPRQTRDADLVADLKPAQAGPLAAALRGSFYADEEMIREAIRRRGSFNLVHLRTGFKVDVYVLGDSDFDDVELSRSRRVRILQAPPRDVMVKSPEDIVLRKLLWYREGGEVSDRQWNDVVDVLRTQGDRLDATYLTAWARRLGIGELLDEATLEARA